MVTHDTVLGTTDRKNPRQACPSATSKLLAISEISCLSEVKEQKKKNSKLFRFQAPQRYAEICVIRRSASANLLALATCCKKGEEGGRG
jgi:hypothetical protein